jgi:hypothetical protein
MLVTVPQRQAAAAVVDLGPSAWSLVGAAVQGRSHIASGTVMQDAHAWAVTDDGRLVIAVADGAGSAARSDEGARAAVVAATAQPDDPLQAARAAVEALAAGLDVPLGDLASTLLVCVVGPDGITGHAIGDGVVVVASVDGTLSALLPPDRGEFRNETVFVTSDTWDVSSRHAALPLDEGWGLALLTDGLELLALDVASGAPHGPFFTPLLRFAQTPAEGAADELASFLCSERVAARTDDDCTLVLAVRSPDP